ncbi:MAG: hypothetical protein HYT16_01915 [DPANN group archaeon]|nr:hypothetical protein [DPANN group archaeon]
MNKRAQTDTVLILGLVVFIAIILLLGWTRLVGPLLKYSYTVEAYEVALGLDAAAAAPEQLQPAFIIANKPATQKDLDIGLGPYRTDRKVSCSDTDVDIQERAINRITGKFEWTGRSAEPLPKYVNDKKLTYLCSKTFGTYSLEKTWEYKIANAQNTLRAVD